MPESPRLNLRSLFSRLFGASRSKRARWEQAQAGEFAWWRDLAANGFFGWSRDGFVSSFQRDWLLSHLKFLDKPLDSWKDGTIVEFGSGPSGFVEYVEAKHKLAVEPLIEQYRQVFPHLASSTVDYLDCPAEEAGLYLQNVADLVVCFNVLDHTREPGLVIRNLAKAAKPGADLLFQVNLFLSEAEARKKTEHHAQLHPHSLYPHTVLGLLQSSGFEIRKQRLADELNADGEHFFICAGVKQ